MDVLEPNSSPWLEEVAAALAMAQSGIMILVDDAHPAQLGALYRVLRSSAQSTEVVAGVRDLMELRAGTTVLFAPRIGEASWMNLYRPAFIDRGYRLVAWCSSETTVALSQQAPDWFDWISLRVECPPTGGDSRDYLPLEAALTTVRAAGGNGRLVALAGLAPESIELVAAALRHESPREIEARLVVA